MIDSLKAALKRGLPAPFLHMARLAFSPNYREHLKAEKIVTLSREAEPIIWAAASGLVMSGPFKGLQYVRQAVCSSLCPKLLGTYELELYPAIDALIDSRPRNIIIIGAAEGYYACGLAMRLPEARVIAFEADEVGRKLLLTMTQANGMEGQISIRGYCNHQELADVLGGCDPVETAIICDIEGGEMDLLDPTRHPQLQKCRLIVELHPWTAEDPAKILGSRLGSTTAGVHTRSCERLFSDFPLGIDVKFTPAQKVACLNEFRPPGMGWLTFSP